MRRSGAAFASRERQAVFRNGPNLFSGISLLLRDLQGFLALSELIFFSRCLMKLESTCPLASFVTQLLSPSIVTSSEVANPGLTHRATI